MKPLHDEETIQEHGYVLFTNGEAQFKTTITEHEGSLLYDGPEAVIIEENTPTNRLNIFKGLLHDTKESDDEDNHECIQKLEELITDSRKALFDEIIWGSDEKTSCFSVKTKDGEEIALPNKQEPYLIGIDTAYYEAIGVDVNEEQYRVRWNVPDAKQYSTYNEYLENLDMTYYESDGTCIDGKKYQIKWNIIPASKYPDVDWDKPCEIKKITN